jgi:hypothetical protein
LGEFKQSRFVELKVNFSSFYCIYYINLLVKLVELIIIVLVHSANITFPIEAKQSTMVEFSITNKLPLSINQTPPYLFEEELDISELFKKISLAFYI